MQKMKEILFSEKGMQLVNILLFHSAIFYRKGFIFIAYLAWVVYLSFCIKQAETNGSNIIYSVFMGIAIIMICINLYFLLRG